MTPQDPIQLARRIYAAYESGDRHVVEELVADDLRFYSPVDVGIDRAAYFERCWPNSELIEAFEFERLVDIGNGEVLVTYEASKQDGQRFRNTEILTFLDGRLAKAEVYFGWNLPQQ
jgi:ketosteroid isomerase-like protein